MSASVGHIGRVYREGAFFGTFLVGEHSFTYTKDMTRSVQKASAVENKKFLNDVEHFPRAILHVDGDSFFASCEIARRPWLRDTPVVTGRERGIASSMNYVAKRLGISRAMRLSEIRKKCPDVIIFSSDYETYSIYAHRMYSIVRRYTPHVEEYSIDECFADLTDCVGPGHVYATYAELVARIKYDLESSLGLTFSLGLAVNKVCAKIASTWNKPSGLTLMGIHDMDPYLTTLPIGKVWGIGRSTSIALKKQGIHMAQDLARRDRAWVRASFPKPIQEIYEELHGNQALSLSCIHEDQSSIQRTRTFRPSSGDKEIIFSELSHNIEGACSKLRRQGAVTWHVSFFIKTQDFRYCGMEIELARPVSTPGEIIRSVREKFGKVFIPGLVYRATGVTLRGLMMPHTVTGSLFDTGVVEDSLHKVYAAADRMGRKYGGQTLFLASSFQAYKKDDGEVRHSRHVKGNIYRRRFAIPFLGEVT